MANQERETVTQALDRVYAGEDSTMDPVLMQLQIASVWTEDRWPGPIPEAPR